jgi:hypothetical protein
MLLETITLAEDKKNIQVYRCMFLDCQESPTTIYTLATHGKKPSILSLNFEPSAISHHIFYCAFIIINWSSTYIFPLFAHISEKSIHGPGVEYIILFQIHNHLYVINKFLYSQS